MRFRRAIGFKEVGDLVGGHAESVVRDLEDDIVVVGADVEFERPAVLHRLERVLDEIEEDLLNLVLVDRDGRQGTGEVETDADAAFLELGLQRREAVLHRLCDGADGEIGLGGTERLEESLEDAVEPLDLTKAFAEALLVFVGPL